MLLHTPKSLIHCTDVVAIQSSVFCLPNPQVQWVMAPESGVWQNINFLRGVQPDLCRFAARSCRKLACANSASIFVCNWVSCSMLSRDPNIPMQASSVFSKSSKLMLFGVCRTTVPSGELVRTWVSMPKTSSTAARSIDPLAMLVDRRMIRMDTRSLFVATLANYVHHCSVPALALGFNDGLVRLELSHWFLKWLG